MLAKDMLKYMLAPYALKEEDVDRLQKLVNEFPYFQPAHLLLSIASRMYDASSYQQNLKKTALVASNRSHLFNLIQEADKAQQKTASREVSSEIKAPNVTEVRDTSIEEELALIQTASVLPEKNIILPETKTEETRQPVTKTNSVPDDEFLEQEIKKQATAARVDKEIISIREEIKKSESLPTAGAANFTEWLALLKQSQVEYKRPEKTPVKVETHPAETPVSKSSETQESSKTDPQSAKKQKQKAIIDKIIESSPGAIRPKEEQKFFTPEKKARESLLDNEHLVTETLARIYALQGNVAKAIRSYEILSLKYPQKSAYFASLIQKLKTNQ